MFESYNAARVRRRNARHSRLERNALEAALGRFASDVNLEHLDLEPTAAQSVRRSEDTRSLAQLRALQVVSY